MEKQLYIKTSSGKKLYKISETSATWYCYRYRTESFFGGWDAIGKARSMEDALAICKSHATQYGSVHSVEFA